MARQEDLFPDYVPKRTPDTINDYISHWAYTSGHKPEEVLSRVPEPSLENLKDAIATFHEYRDKARKNPGKFVPGNMILGASPEECVPSVEALVVSEVGGVIKKIVGKTSKGDLAAYKKKHGIKNQKIVFVQVTFDHADIMGSGRFTYAYVGQEISMDV